MISIMILSLIEFLEILHAFLKSFKIQRAVNNLMTLHNFILSIGSNRRFYNTTCLSTVLLSCWHCARDPIATLWVRSYQESHLASTHPTAVQQSCGPATRRGGRTPKQV